MKYYLKQVQQSSQYFHFNDNSNHLNDLVIRIFCPHSDSLILSDLTILKTPSGDYKTQNFSQEDLI